MVPVRVAICGSGGGFPVVDVELGNEFPLGTGRQHVFTGHSRHPATLPDVDTVDPGKACFHLASHHMKPHVSSSSLALTTHWPT